MGIISSIGPVAKVLLKVLQLVDPKTREWVNKRKALEWGERYILTNDELRHYAGKKLTKKEKKRQAVLERKLYYYRKWFFLSN